MATDVELTAVRPAHRFDEPALAAYLADHLDGFGGPMEVQQFEGGQSNPTFQLTAAGRDYVLRKKPPGDLLPSAHLVHREYRVIKALAESGVPVPEAYHLCRDPAIIGTDFFVMEKVEGRVLIDPSLQSFSRAERAALYDHFIEILAALHQVDYQAVGLGDFGRPGNFYARQIDRWTKQYVASKTDDLADMDKLMAWLPDNIPASDDSAIAHGDYRISNCVLHPSEPRIVAVLDWELCTLGHPLADLSYCCMGYHGTISRGDTFVGIDFEATGIPTEQAFVARYCELTGRDGIDDWTFYIVFSLFRSAAIVQGVYKRGLDGNASSDQTDQFADSCRIRADWAWRLVRS